MSAQPPPGYEPQSWEYIKQMALDGMNLRAEALYNDYCAGPRLNNFSSSFDEAAALSDPLTRGIGQFFQLPPFDSVLPAQGWQNLTHATEEHSSFGALAPQNGRNFQPEPFPSTAMPTIDKPSGTAAHGLPFVVSMATSGTSGQFGTAPLPRNFLPAKDDRSDGPTGHFHVGSINPVIPDFGRSFQPESFNASSLTANEDGHSYVEDAKSVVPLLSTASTVAGDADSNAPDRTFGGGLAMNVSPTTWNVSSHTREADAESDKPSSHVLTTAPHLDKAPTIGTIDLGDSAAVSTPFAAQVPAGTEDTSNAATPCPFEPANDRRASEKQSVTSHGSQASDTQQHLPITAAMTASPTTITTSSTVETPPTAAAMPVAHNASMAAPSTTATATPSAGGAPALAENTTKWKMDLLGQTCPIDLIKDIHRPRDPPCTYLHICQDWWKGIKDGRAHGTCGYGGEYVIHDSPNSDTSVVHVRKNCRIYFKQRKECKKGTVCTWGHDLEALRWKKETEARAIKARRAR